MSIFGSLMGDIDDDPFYGSHMNMMRHMNTMMNSFFGDPFGMHMGFNDFDRGRGGSMQNSLMPPFPMPMMPHMNRLLGGSLDSLGHHGHHMMGGGSGGGHSYSSSTVVSMSSGPDGRPQVYKATSSTRTAPGGIKETQKTVQDSRTGTKRMAIGHHIGERAHIVEKEHNVHTGDQEEREDFINLEEEEAEDFNREWEHKAARTRSEIPRIASIPALSGRNNRHSYGGHSGGGGSNGGSGLLAITAGPSSRRRQRQAATARASPPLVSPRRTIRSSPMSTSRLETTLRFLATGETFRSLMYSTRIHESTISRFVPEICRTICKVLEETYLKTPRNAEQWMAISKQFDDMWQFPHCLGALDGRHIEFRAPISTGAYYYNYKGTKSIVLLGLVDANYRFTYVNIGVNGRISDGGVFAQSGLAAAIHNESLDFPPAEALPGQDKTTPYVIVADDAFPLSTHLMKPYPERGLSHDRRIFNYRLSRARRIVENAFGILANRFRLLLTPIGLAVEKVELLTRTCVILHNFLATTNGKTYLEAGSDVNLQQMPRVGRQGANRTSNISLEIRDNFAHFFNSPHGAVSWQEKSIGIFNY